jgi:hypothetical protein
MKPEQDRNIRNFILGFIVFGVIGYLFLMVWMRADLGEFRPDSSTSTTMYVLKRRILHYAKLNNKLPTSIEELTELEGFINRNTDGWGLPIRMVITGTEVTLHSYGKDNKSGGTGVNQDFIHIFEAKTSSNEWADENDEGSPSWKKLSKIRWDKSEYQ